MTTLLTRLTKRTGIVVLSCALVILLAGVIISHYATRQLTREIKSNRGNVSDVTINIFAGSITLDGLSLRFGPDSIKSSNNVVLEKVVFRNVSVYNYLVHKELQIGKVFISNGNLTIDKNLPKRDSASANNNVPLRGISIERFIVDNTNVTVTDAADTAWTATFDVAVDRIKSGDTTNITDLQAYNVEAVEATIKDLILHDGKGLYKTKVNSIRLNSGDESLAVDSIFLLPQHPKYKFSRVAGKQIDRINTFIKELRVTGLRYRQLRDSAFVASNIRIRSAEVYSFRDKRMPFREKENKPLPMQALSNLGFHIEIDSIIIDNAKITYEEFPAEGFRSGKVVFDDLHAIFKNVNNRMYYNTSNTTTLQAHALLMGKGLLEAKFTLPLKNDQPYHAEGKISKFNLSHLNPALENLAFVQIESGRLNQINFSFDYTDRFSNGLLTVNYEDLKIKGLKKEKNPAINDLKTFLINTVVKNDKSTDVPTEKRTGKILFERDRKRQIFNYWWKSLLAGIKASVLENGQK